MPIQCARPREPSSFPELFRIFPLMSMFPEASRLKCSRKVSLPFRPSRARPVNTSSMRPEPPVVRLTSPVSVHFVEPFHVPVQSLVPLQLSRSPVAGSTLMTCVTQAPTGLVQSPFGLDRWGRWSAEAAEATSATHKVNPATAVAPLRRLTNFEIQGHRLPFWAHVVRGLHRGANQVKGGRPPSPSLVGTGEACRSLCL